MPRKHIIGGMFLVAGAMMVSSIIMKLLGGTALDATGMTGGIVLLGWGAGVIAGFIRPR